MTGDAVKAKNGSMVAYDGQMAFKKMSGGGEGLRGMVTRRITGEQMTVMEVKGQRHLLLRRPRQRDQPGPAATARSCTSRPSNLLCTDAGLRTGTTFTGLRGASQGNGLFTTTVEGTGQAAIMSDGPGRGAAGHPGSTRSRSTPARTSRIRATSSRTSSPA